MGTLSDTTAFLTGGAGGIGRATCRMLLADGAHVTICGRSESRLATASEAIRASSAPGATVQTMSCDVTIAEPLEVVRQSR